MASADIPVVLTIAGFDPSSGAGMTADLKTMAAFGCFGVAAITAVTIQNTQGIRRVEVLPVELLRDTLHALAEDAEISAIKVGMLGSAAAATRVARFLESQEGKPIVLDPILKSTSGAELLDREGVSVLRDELLPLATVITPNMAEAEALVGTAVRDLAGMRAAARELQRFGAFNVVVTGGHLPENIDVLALEGGEILEFPGAKVESNCTHGTGCAFSTAIACGLALKKDLQKAVEEAKEFIRRAIETGYPTGKGTGPLNHLFRLG
jgi:hydroxymethylpyrimidine/phosphomethylpyrimidine kinase